MKFRKTAVIMSVTFALGVIVGVSVASISMGSRRTVPQPYLDSKDFRSLAGAEESIDRWRDVSAGEWETLLNIYTQGPMTKNVPDEVKVRVAKGLVMHPPFENVLFSMALAASQDTNPDVRDACLSVIESVQYEVLPMARQMLLNGISNEGTSTLYERKQKLIDAASEHSVKR